MPSTRVLFRRGASTAFALVALTTAGLTGTSASGTAAPAHPLAGRTVVIDPGHQLGNSRFPRQINRLVDARGFEKPCNTTGTATNAGYPEATFAWGVATRLRDRLTRLGAHVVMTRNRNSSRAWGPCVDVRGKIGSPGYAGSTTRADLKISIHGDGAAGSAHGFHVITASKRAWSVKSTAYAVDIRSALQAAGFARSTYIGGGTALDRRGDLATLNWSSMPTAMVELGNMRNAGDARTMTAPSGQDRYAVALASAARAFLTK